MLSEYEEVRQREGEGFRRWFSDPYFDVIIWYDRKGGEMTGFQVCYDKGRTERAYTRKLEARMVRSHRFVANGPVEVGSNKMTSILKGDAAAVDEAVLSRFRDSAMGLEPELVEAIVSEMEEYNRKLLEADGMDPDRPPTAIALDNII
jgi:hypothetical protein